MHRVRDNRHTCGTRVHNVPEPCLVVMERRDTRCCTQGEMVVRWHGAADGRTADPLDGNEVS